MFILNTRHFEVLPTISIAHLKYFEGHYSACYYGNHGEINNAWPRANLRKPEATY